jgi:hypothetical protein
VRGPALSNLKQSISKMIEIMEKYERGKKNKEVKMPESRLLEGKEELQETLEQLSIENRKLKKGIKVSWVLFVISYIVTMMLIFFLN